MSAAFDTIYFHLLKRLSAGVVLALLVMYILGSIHTWPVGLILFASAHIHPLPARALLVSLKGLSSAHYFLGSTP